MVVWLRPECILALITSLFYYSQLVSTKSYDKFWCATEEGLHQISCPDDQELLTDVTIRKVYRRTQMCEPDDHTEFLIHCQAYVDSSLCEGNQTCSIQISSRDYLQCQNKTYTPTYFFVKYTCTQIHTMCTDVTPIRNTLYGYIVSPAYPHPMADNLKCSISIEADPSMFIELSPIQIQLQDAFRCRSEYIEIFGYDPSTDKPDQNDNHFWKSYHLWCGNQRSIQGPQSNARYLIASNSIYISLQTTISKRSRYFKIRYKIVPMTARSQYNSDGMLIESSGKEQSSFDNRVSTSTDILLTTTIISAFNQSDFENFNGTVTKKTKFRKEILIGIIAGVVALLLAIAIGIIVFILIKKRRNSANTRKKPAATSVNNTTAKSSDKAPLLEQTKSSSTTDATKRKLVPERTIQINDTGGPSKLKANETKTDTPATKPAFTAADSGIYGADLSEEAKPVVKSPPVTTAVSEPIKPSEADPTAAKPPSPPPPTETESLLPKNPETDPTENIIPTVVVNPLNEPISVVLSDEQQPTTTSSSNHLPLDTTIQSAYPNIIDATTSENEGTICGSTIESRRTSLQQSINSINRESNTNLETIVIHEQTDHSLSHNIIPFNPLHVILKDANKYYTTEYI